MRWFGVAVVLFYGFLATLALPHTTALRNIFLYTSMLAFAASLWRRELQWPRVDRSVWFLLAYAIVALAAVLVNRVDTLESLQRARSELLVQAYVLAFVLVYVQNRPSPRLIVAPLALGFALLVLYAVLALAYYALWKPEIFTPDFHLRQIVDRYGLDAQFYLPIAAASLALFPLGRGARLVLLLVVAVGFALAVAYNTTSGVVLVAVYLAFLAGRYLRRRYRIGVGQLALLALLAAIGLALALTDEGYKKIADQARFASEGKYFAMLSARGGLWAIGAQCASDAPWYGYGYNEKKAALVCDDEKYLRPARESGNPMAEYFHKDNYGKVSLHNQYLANWFESGWPGSFFWLAFFIGACLSAWKKRADELQALVVLPSLLIFLAGCLFNGLWEGHAASMGIMVLLGLALAERRAASEPA